MVEKRFAGLYYDYTVECEADGARYRVVEMNGGDGSAFAIGDACVMAVAGAE